VLGAGVTLAVSVGFGSGEGDDVTVSVGLGEGEADGFFVAAGVLGLAFGSVDFSGFASLFFLPFAALSGFPQSLCAASRTLEGSFFSTALT
jgi:hypothetical protein